MAAPMHARLEDRIVTLTAFLEAVVRGELADVEAALDAHPEFLTAPGDVPQYAVVSANALWVAAMCGRDDVVKLLLARGAESRSSQRRRGVSDCDRSDRKSPTGRPAPARQRLRHGYLRRGGARGREQAPSAARGGPCARRSDDTRWQDASALRRQRGCRNRPSGRGHTGRFADASGQTPVQWIAVTGRYGAVCACLKEHGAKPNRRTPSGPACTETQPRSSNS